MDESGANSGSDVQATQHGELAFQKCGRADACIRMRPLHRDDDCNLVCKCKPTDSSTKSLVSEEGSRKVVKEKFKMMLVDGYHHNGTVH